MECSVCIEPYNKSNRKKVACPSCDYEICRGCVETYLLGTHEDPHCMNCRHVWEREFLDSVFTKKFVNTTLKQHRENILLEREKCLMPATQPSVERTLLVRRAEKELKKQEDALEQLRGEVWRQRDMIYQLRHSRATNADAPVKFCRKCPVENCKGFLSTQWKCQICENKICKDCNCIKGEEHECDPNDVETVKMLEKDTKPCPSCGEMIFKISGCSQMWCTSCHTAFNWNTGRVEKGVIHNPHFIEFQRNNRDGAQLRNPADIPCGGRPSVSEIMEGFDRLGYDPAVRPQQAGYRRHIYQGRDEDETLFIVATRLCGHIQMITLMFDYPEVHPPDNEHLRIRYMLNELGEEDFKRQIQKNEKTYKKKSEIRDVVAMFLNATDDLLRQFCVDPVQLQEIKKTLLNLRVYTNNSLNKIGKRYGCMVPQILTDMTDIVKFNAV